jgi:hypothetical protein
MIRNPFLAEIDELYREKYSGGYRQKSERSAHLKNHYFPKSPLTFDFDGIQQLVHLGLGKTDGFFNGERRKNTWISFGKPK